jgi:hypothetical protein
MPAGARRFRKLLFWLLVAGVSLLVYRWGVAYKKQQQLAEQIELTIEKPKSPETGGTFTVSARNKSAVPVAGQEISFIAEGLFEDVEVEQQVGDFPGSVPPGETAHTQVRFDATVDDCRVRLSPVAFFPGSAYFTRVSRPHEVFKGEQPESENPQ